MKQKADSWEIAVFSEENIAGAAALAAKCFTTPWSETIYRRELENPRSIGFVCTDGGKVIGFIHCNYVVDELTLNTLAVDEEYRRRGIAKRLWEEVRAMTEGFCTICFLEVRESNLPARKLYESLGFVICGYRAQYYHLPDEPALLMSIEF